MDNERYNSLTGTYSPVSQEDEEVKKSGQLIWPSLVGQDDDNESNGKDFEKFERDIPIFIDVEKADERIVCGIVYEPDTEDAQGDSASEDEIRKACYYFMEKTRQFKVMHKGKPAKIEILENYLAPQDLTISGRKIKKGSWVLVTRILDKKVWQDIKAGKLTGYSMAGYAKIA